MISLQPREQFTIVRQLGDHTDPTTYYVQAVIRDSISGDIIDTVRLTNKGNGRFTKLWEVPSDVSGLGFYIDIETTVYDDSGYTSKASAYTVENEQYLVFDRIMKQGGGGSGGADVDYKKIQKMIDAIVKKFPEMKEADFKPIMEAIEGVKKSVEEIEIPEAEKLDHTPVIKAIIDGHTAILKKIDEKEVTPETDLSPIMDAITDVAGDVKAESATTRVKIAGVQKVLDEHVDEHRNEQSAEAKLGEVTQKISEILGSDITSPKNLKKDTMSRVKDLMGGGQ